MEVVLYSTDCPKCKVLETKLEQKNIIYNKVSDVQEMQAKGFNFAPMLAVDGVIYDFKKAVEWIGGQ